MAIVITAEPQQEIVVSLVGIDYKIHPPKASLAVGMAIRVTKMNDDPGEMVDTLNQWIDMAFTKKDAAAVKKRMQAPDDLLDLIHVATLIEAVVEEVSGNPPTSPSD